MTSPDGHRAHQAGMAVLAAICFTVAVTVLTGGHLFIWPGWLAFWMVLRLLHRGRLRVGAPLKGPRPR